MSSLDTRAIDEKDLKQADAPPVRHDYRVFMSEEAFDRAVARGETDTSREIGGVLVGEVVRDEAGPYLRIDGTIDALHADEKGAEVTFTHATWKHIHEEMDQKHEGKAVVGWYHTHPGFGIFLSDRDQFIHKSFFNLPFQVAFVYDPKSKEHGFFVWRDNEVARMRRYWVGSREQLWDGARTNAPAKREGTATAKPEHEPPPQPASEASSIPASMMQLLATGLVCILVGGFVGHFLGSCSSRAPAGEEQQSAQRSRVENAMTAATFQTELVGLLRETLGDEAVRKPVGQAIKELDASIAALEATYATMPADPAKDPAKDAPKDPPKDAPKDAPKDSTGSGSATPTTGSGSAAGSGSAEPPPPPAAPRERVRQTISRLKVARDSLIRLAEDRRTAEVALAKLQRTGNAQHISELAREVAGQRAGLGQLYAEAATDAAKAGDAVRARRLLVTAAHLDPGNHARYEKQLQTFEKAGSLPPPPTTGEKR